MQIAQWFKVSLVLNVRRCWFKSCWCHVSWLNDKYLYCHRYLTCGSGSPVPYYSHRSGFQFWKYVNPQVQIRVTHRCTHAHPYSQCEQASAWAHFIDSWKLFGKLFMQVCWVCPVALYGFHHQQQHSHSHLQPHCPPYRGGHYSKSQTHILSTQLSPYWTVVVQTLLLVWGSSLVHTGHQLQMAGCYQILQIKMLSRIEQKLWEIRWV